MSFESARKTVPEAAEKSIEERIAENELRVQRLLGETQAHLARIPNGDELARTIEGQAKLLKLEDSARHFNERVISAVGAVANIAFLAQMFEKIGGLPDLSPQTWQFLAEGATMATVPAALIGAWAMIWRSRGFHKAASATLETMKS